MKEANYTTTEGLHLEQYLHGPFVSTDEGCLVTFIAPPVEDPEDRTIDIIGAATEVGARTAAILQTGDESRAPLVDTVISVPECDEMFSPIVYLAPLQLLTYWLALELGHNPDTFRLDGPETPRRPRALHTLSLVQARLSAPTGHGYQSGFVANSSGPSLKPREGISKERQWCALAVPRSRKTNASASCCLLKAQFPRSLGKRDYSVYRPIVFSHAILVANRGA